METMTAAVEFRTTVARYFHINSRTRHYRKGLDVKAEIVEAVQLAATVPGYYSEATQQGLRVAFAAICGYRKHILGCRISGVTISKINDMTPWQFTLMLADMIDKGVSNAFEAELYFQAM
jgi:hypothetical protein